MDQKLIHSYQTPLFFPSCQHPGSHERRAVPAAVLTGPQHPDSAGPVWQPPLPHLKNHFAEGRTAPLSAWATQAPPSVRLGNVSWSCLSFYPLSWLLPSSLCSQAQRAPTHPAGHRLPLCCWCGLTPEAANTTQQSVKERSIIVNCFGLHVQLYLSGFYLYTNTVSLFALLVWCSISYTHNLGSSGTFTSCNSH